MPAEAWKVEVAQRWSALTLPKKEKKEPERIICFATLDADDIAAAAARKAQRPPLPGGADTAHMGHVCLDPGGLQQIGCPGTGDGS